MRRRVGQLSLDLPTPRTWGGKREGAGRKRVAARPGVPHRRRPFHEGAHPVHLTWRVAADLGSLRRSRVVPAIEGAIAAGCGERFRVIQYSIQPDHLHLLVEAADRAALTHGGRGLGIRMARAINRALGRGGQVFVERYHDRPCATPREVRNALVYVLLNAVKHVAGARGLDPCSSGPWFDGWKQSVARAHGPAAVARPITWLARVGWRRHGPISVWEAPRGARP